MPLSKISAVKSGKSDCLEADHQENAAWFFHFAPSLGHLCTTQSAQKIRTNSNRLQVCSSVLACAEPLREDLWGRSCILHRIRAEKKKRCHNKHWIGVGRFWKGSLLPTLFCWTSCRVYSTKFKKQCSQVVSSCFLLYLSILLHPSSIRMELCRWRRWSPRNRRTTSFWGAHPPVKGPDRDRQLALVAL